MAKLDIERWVNTKNLPNITQDREWLNGLLHPEQFAFVPPIEGLRSSVYPFLEDLLDKVEGNAVICSTYNPTRLWVLKKWPVWNVWSKSLTTHPVDTVGGAGGIRAKPDLLHVIPPKLTVEIPSARVLYVHLVNNATWWENSNVGFLQIVTP